MQHKSFGEVSAACGGVPAIAKHFQITEWAVRKWARRIPAERCHGLVALKQGRLKKRPCLICGSEQSEAHHFDYRLPENVIWLCDRHHKDVHKIAHEIDRQIEALENLREVAA